MTAASDNHPLLRVEGLAKSFALSEGALGHRRRGARVHAVNGLSFSVDRGQTLSLVGESGCGKSTVARLVTGLHRPDSGAVYIDGTEVSRLRRRRDLRPFGRRLQMIFQDPFASLNPRWRVAQIVAEPMRAFALTCERSAIEARVAELLTQVGLRPEDAQKFPHEFSGGQRQRISIARALASNPEFLVCDEPTSALDVSVQSQILNLLTELQERLKLGYLFISHNLSVVYHVSHRVGVMYLGRLVEIGPTDAIFSRPRHPYTRLLLDTVPDIEMSGRNRRPITGEVPNPIDLPQGCVFHPRCPLARDVCRKVAPAVTQREDDVSVACHAVTESWNQEFDGPHP
ncbi:oligopeptide/dipeptide ABC transporter ATP-binding protein [Bradyrhizobium sp. NP1]|uniref:ABC transporter ATP-binding protein n=1 Tax=Bradyrhizobium sp. NP1 TaxID=3049772 RepID=UPI0025A52368|nr:oligopeptide/dipeptide ABC transporter ATP-binding protein [Bradyrhizobium sp. NP1]WJR77263.1 ATP-binding cassette domain-containing protein [Bradyrhizobium sp. NP1]